jgi:hypothetical protein
MAVERWKIDIKDYIAKVKARESNSQRIYGLALGQRSPAIRSRMEAHADWIITDAASNVMGLLSIIQQCMTLRQTRKHVIHSLFDAETLVLKYVQGAKDHVESRLLREIQGQRVDGRATGERDWNA